MATPKPKPVVDKCVYHKCKYRPLDEEDYQAHYAAVHKAAEEKAKEKQKIKCPVCSLHKFRYGKPLSTHIRTIHREYYDQQMSANLPLYPPLEQLMYENPVTGGDDEEEFEEGNEQPILFQQHENQDVEIAEVEKVPDDTNGAAHDHHVVDDVLKDDLLADDRRSDNSSKSDDNDDSDPVKYKPPPKKSKRYLAQERKIELLMAERDEQVDKRNRVEKKIRKIERKISKEQGVNRHFQMVFIHDKLNNSISSKISSKAIWTHLMEMYDLQALNESEILPFPNKDVDFRLPENDYRELMNRDYPRAPRSDRLPASEEQATSTQSHSGHSKTKGRDKDKDKEREKEREATSTPSHVTKAHEAEDSPKREQRKRTRQSLADSPATRERDTPTTKRARRT